MKRLINKFKETDKVTLIDIETKEEFTGDVSSISWDVVSMKNVKGFTGLAVFEMGNFQLKA